ncbi:phosphoethanolamine transferase [Snodgrassella communis]|uniref:phosphoethanolamine transferase n=1 Tax=Snodgrassella communis TaxID=2946699 RepID=UPI001EF5637D|nr:phosphoethanolamine transferase [Snodgrassella communis]
MNLQKLKNIILYTMYIISVVILLFGLGYVKEWTNKDIIVGLIFFCCYLLSAGHRILLITLLLSFSALAFYFPTGIIYGKPTANILTPLLQTNRLEIIGYLLAVKYQILLSIIFICIQFFIYLLAKNKSYKNNISIYMIFIFFYLISLFGISVNHKRINDGAFLRNIIISYKSIEKRNTDLKTNIGNNKNIKVSKIDADDDTELHVVIIGESVRRDYMSVYGYPIQTTPFLNIAKGIFIDGLVSVAPNTEQSLNRTLFKTVPSNNKIDWGLNVVSIANKAGYETYWISNQGRGGEYGEDVLFSLSGLAKQNYFLKQGNFLSNNSDDNEMLPIFSKIISNNKNSKVIFIHMMGSHEPVCSRLGTFKPSFQLYDEASCYAATIAKLDLFIKNVTDIMKGKKYKLMYFSDHGLSVEKKRVFHDVDLYEEYQVPLFYLDSETKKQIHIKKVISGFNLLDIYSSFINIKTNITNENFSFQTASQLHDDPDPIIYWQKYKHISELNKKQPPITDIGTNSITLKNVVELKNNYTFSDKCFSVIDSVDHAYPFSPIYKISGWAASSKDNKPLNGIIGSFIIDNNKVFFIEGENKERDDVRDHFKFLENQSNSYGIESLLEKKHIINKDVFYFGYKNELNNYIICKKP